MANSLPWNQENVDSKVAEIKALSEPERRDISNLIKEDIRGGCKKTLSLQIFKFNAWANGHYQ